MSEKFIKILIVSSILIISSLIAVQIYWISNALQLKKAQFQQNVYKAVHNFTAKYERLENAYMFQNRKFYNQQNTKIKKPTTNKNQTKTYSLKSDSIYTAQPDLSVNIGKDQIQPPSKELAKRYGFKDTVVSSSTWFSVSVTDSSISVSGNSSVTINETGQLTENQIKKRMNNPLIDSLLKVELENVGVSAKYEYAVFDMLNFPVWGKFKDITRLVHSSYAANLYPRSILGSDKIIKVFFPNQKSYIIKDTSFILLVSVALVFLIIFIFYKSISTIIKQKQLSVIRNDFINNMTHELKTPISTISIACEALNDPDVSGSKDARKSFTNIINDENKRLGEMVEKVLKNAAYEKMDFSLKLELDDIHSTLTKAISNIEIQVNKKNGQISKSLDATSTMLMVDKFHIFNVFLNILDNANKYTLENPQINVSSFNNEKGIYISIKDNGIGISKENQRKIFDKFYRIPTGDVHDVKGFGLGLSYAYNIVQKLGGEITVSAEKNKGSEFIIFLPNDNT